MIEGSLFAEWLWMVEGSCNVTELFLASNLQNQQTRDNKPNSSRDPEAHWRKRRGQALHSGVRDGGARSAEPPATAAAGYGGQSTCKEPSKCLDTPSQAATTTDVATSLRGEKRLK